MALVMNFAHNGITKVIKRAPMALGPLSDHIVAVVGTAPNADAAAFPLNTPVRVSTEELTAQLDTTNSGEGFLVHFCDMTRQQANVPIYVIRVDEGADEAATIANIIGGVDGTTGQKKGIKAIYNCFEKPTIIAAPGYSKDIGVAQALGAVSLDINCLFTVDLVGAKATDVAAMGDALGNDDTGFGNCVAIAHTAKYNNHYGDLVMPGSVVATGRIAAEKPWMGPGHRGVAISGVDVYFEYNPLSNATDGSLLNKHGICYFGNTSAGGWSLIGNRTLTGRFISHVGLEHALIRKLTLALEKGLGRNLTKTFMEQEVGKVNNWLESLIADEVVMPGSSCYLHPEKNTVDNYKSGRWFIVVEYGAYGVNENTVIELHESDGVVKAFLENVLAA